MFAAKVYGAASTVIGTVTMGASLMPKPGGVPLTHIPGLGDVPLFAVGVGMATAFLVRWVVMTSSTRKLRSYNVAVTALAMLGAATFIIDHQITVGNSFWVGLTFGSAGVGLIHAAKSKLVTILFDSVRSGLIKGMRDDPPSEQ